MTNILFVIPFTYCAMISFRCVVNNDPGVDKYTQEGLEVNSGFSQDQSKKGFLPVLQGVKLMNTCVQVGKSRSMHVW